MERGGVRLLALMIWLLPAMAHAYSPLPDCSSDGSHALTSTKSNQTFACTTITGGGGGGSPGGSTNDIQYKSGASTFDGITLTNGQVLVGQTGSTPLAKTMSGDCTLAASGAITCTKTSGSSFVASATTDTTNASNITTGNLPFAQLPKVVQGVGSAFMRSQEMGSVPMPDQAIMNGQIVRVNKANTFLKTQNFSQTATFAGVTNFPNSKSVDASGNATFNQINAGAGTRSFIATGGTGGIVMRNDGGVKWVADTNAGGGTIDTGISRDAAGVIDVGNGTAQDVSGSVKAVSFIQNGTAFSSSKFINAVTATVGMASYGGL